MSDTKKMSEIRQSKLHDGGVYTALVTPFKKGQVDFQSLERLITHQIANGVNGFVVNGTTAESPTLNPSEVDKVYRKVRGTTKGLVPVIMGTGSNSTQQTIQNSKRAERLGVDAVLVVVPYYNKPTQHGMFEHFKAVAESIKLPVILYNVPGRTIVSLNELTVAKLSRIKNIVGIKEASGDMKLFMKMKKLVSKNFIWLSGDDSSATEFLARGGDGVISVVSHVIPKEFCEMVDATKTQRKRNHFFESRFKKLNRNLGLEANPIPVKMMLSQMKLIDSSELRLPLTRLSADHALAVKGELKKLGVI